MIHKYPVFYLLLLCLLASQSALSEDLEAIRLTARVTDLTATLSSQDIAKLESVLKDFEGKTSTQLVVLLVPSMGEQSIEEVAYEIAKRNKIGQKGKDNGILLLVSKNDRQLRIEVGYGLEGSLPDALAGLIIRREIVPLFRQGDYLHGIEAGVNAIMRATFNEYTADEEPRSSSRRFSPIAIVLLLLLLVARGLFGRRRRDGFGWFGPGYSMRLPSGGGFGGAGGFSGGGGSFGGGGASGRW